MPGYIVLQQLAPQVEFDLVILVKNFLQQGNLISMNNDGSDILKVL